MFQVWAPEAKQVRVEVEGRGHPMTRRADGWWIAQPGDIRAGVDYAFRIDEDSPLPDPRSAWQPHGVHGASRVLDHAEFRWSDQGFQAPPLSSAVIYELHVGTFTPEGTFAAAIDKLDHLVDLGITHVELMPVAAWDGPRGWGYDGVALFAPHQAYGGPTGLKQLVDACHRRGLAVILDVVYNHLGPSGNYLPRFGPYFTERHHTAWGWAVNFDTAGSDEVRRFVIDNAVMWLRDYHIDGLRLDAIHAIIDTSACHILEELAIRVEALQAELGRHLVLIAESDLNDPRLIRSREIGGYGLDAHWSDDFHHALHAVLTGERAGYYQDFGKLEQLAAVLKSPYLLAGGYSEYRRRRHGRSPAGLPGHRFVACLQNHDQVGNRASGERISHLAGIERAKIGAAILLTAPYVPLVFQGEEWAASSPFQYFTSFEDQELGRAVREGRRREFARFGWKPQDVPDPQDPATFQRSRLRWEERDHQPHRGMLRWYQELIRLRHRLPCLSDGRLDRVEVACDARQQWLRLERGPVTLACNLSQTNQHVPLEAGRPMRVLLSSPQGLATHELGINLPEESVAVLGAVEGPMP
jgi:maltooligosyltrehalose trehalohydrolase